MKYLSYSILLILLVGCTKTIQKEDLKYLNGYWEIELVESATKKIKKYAVNTTVDYFSIDADGNGFRKKTKSDFSGKYRANHIKDTLHVIFRGNVAVLQTKTPYDTWEETIVALTDKKLTLRNSKGILFHYKRHQKFNLD